MDNFERCKSCKYYKQFYVLKNMHFRPYYGRCVHEKHTRRYSFENLVENCAYWEDNGHTPEQTKTSVKEAIYEINEKLHNILEVLELDKE